MEDQQKDSEKRLSEIAEQVQRLANGTSVSSEMQFAYRQVLKLVKP